MRSNWASSFVVYAGFVTLLSTPPALALTAPTPGKADPHICDVTYNPDDVIDVHAQAGNVVGIRFDASETIMDVPLSDTSHVKRATGNGSSNILWLKATERMPAQPIGVRTKRPDGSFRDYAFRWQAVMDEKPSPIVSAAVGGMKAEEIPPPPNFCYMIRFIYPNDVKAAQIAAWRARQAKEQADAAEVALHQAEANRLHNVRYVAQGDLSIGPTEIYDDGNTTTLVFPGNTQIPVIFSRLPDKGTDAELTGFTVEEGGVVKIHGTLPFIRLRSGDLVLCIRNLGWTAIGDNPGTGTTSPHIERTVGHL